MKNAIILSLIMCAPFTLSHSSTSNRQMEFSNETVTVWKTEVYPSNKNQLSMHRHDHDRVVVALTDGKLKIKDNKGKIHYFTLVKHKAYYLTKDKPNELHTDENVTKHQIVVMVIELNR
jgi:hypothetical protein